MNNEKEIEILDDFLTGHLDIPAKKRVEVLKLKDTLEEIYTKAVTFGATKAYSNVIKVTIGANDGAEFAALQKANNYLTNLPANNYDTSAPVAGRCQVCTQSMFANRIRSNN